MNYQIIKDESVLNDFIGWLPDLKENEKFYCSLFARKKYSPEGKGPSSFQLERFLSTKENLFEKIKRLEVPIGAYQFRGEDIEQEALALYINPNPRDLLKATYDGIMKLTNGLKNKHQNINPHQEMMSCIQRSKGQRLYLDFDIDDVDFDLTQLTSFINESCLNIVRTRGGYHVLIELSEISTEFKKTFHNGITSLGVDQVGDQLLPIPGCVHGGFMPRFVAIKDELTVGEAI